MLNPLRVLVVTRLFPNTAEPTAAAFNRQQFAAMSRRCELTMWAVIPWFPGVRLAARWSSAGRLVGVPAAELVDGIDVCHPRVLYVPRIGHAFAPWLYVASLAARMRRLRGRVDVVLGSWAFPDGVAAVEIGRRLGVPAVVKLHGSDLNIIAEQPAPGRLLRMALPRAERVIAVSRGLAAKACALGVPADRVVIVGNGVDRALFHPRDRGQARAALRAGGVGDLPSGARVLLFVGHLDRHKGVFELLQAFAHLRAERHDVVLALVGSGPELGRCRDRARALGGQVIVAGARPLDEVATWMAASDLLVLPSWNEGTPNVVLEALASGRRVVASAVGGIPDVLGARVLGELVAPRDVPALTEALARAVDQPYDPAVIAAVAPADWSESGARLLDVLCDAVEARRRSAKLVAAQSISNTPAMSWAGSSR